MVGLLAYLRASGFPDEFVFLRSFTGCIWHVPGAYKTRFSRSAFVRPFVRFLVSAYFIPEEPRSIIRFWVLATLR